ncbi:MAG: hypothetical protein WKF61_02535 [Luteimonas sp.]
MLAKGTVPTHRAGARIVQRVAVTPQLDPIDLGALHLGRECPLLFDHGADLPAGEVVFATCEGARASLATQHVVIEHAGQAIAARCHCDYSDPSAGEAGRTRS